MMTAAEKSFHQLIQKNLENVLAETPSKTYDKYAPGSFSTLDEDDKTIFNKLYTAKSNAQTGNGEVALFWLWNYHKTNLDEDGIPSILHCRVTQGGNKPDLKYGTTNIEIKSYPLSENKKTNIGRFQGQEDFVYLVNQIFSFRNVTNGERGTSSSTLLFGFKELRDAAEAFCSVRFALHDMDLAKYGKVFENMKAKTDEWDKKARSVGLKSCTKAAGRPGGLHIAIELIRYGIRTIMGDKPGDKGYVLNVVGSETTFENEFSWHQIVIDDMTTNETVLSLGSGSRINCNNLPTGTDFKDTQTFGFNGATFSANLMRLFPKGGGKK